MNAEQLAKLAVAGMMGAGMASVPLEAAVWATDGGKFMMTHDCAGLNVCRGLGGCKVTDQKLVKLAGKAGVAEVLAGEAHECAGLNECRGLGGCGVTPEKAVKLAVSLAEDQGYQRVHDCAGLNVCKGLGGCKVTAEKLVKLAEKIDIPLSKVGEPHECAGLNECKGLGGCSVSEEKFMKLKKGAVELWK